MNGVLLKWRIVQAPLSFEDLEVDMEHSVIGHVPELIESSFYETDYSYGLSDIS